jgi:hypothetical protein
VNADEINQRLSPAAAIMAVYEKLAHGKGVVHCWRMI